MAFNPFFLDAPNGRRFCIHAPARGPARGVVLYVHPFAEEMNRSRRMASLTARALGDAGYEVLLMDLEGCGDSAGDFADATWAGWIDDVLAGAAWLGKRGCGPLWIWTLRVGSLLAAGALARGVSAAGLLLVQPVFAGELALRQFLRLKLGASLLGGGERADVDGLLRDLAGGTPVEVGGYSLGPGLARGLGAAGLTLPEIGALRIACIELSTGRAGELSPVLSSHVSQWRAAGHAVRATSVDAAPFWQTAESTISPALVDACVAALEPDPA